MQDREVGTVNVIVAVNEEKSHAPLINLEIRISKFERSQSNIFEHGFDHSSLSHLGGARFKRPLVFVGIRD
jgi:adenosylcobinamide amidohydrolase